MRAYSHKSIQFIYEYDEYDNKCFLGRGGQAEVLIAYAYEKDENGNKKEETKKTVAMKRISTQNFKPFEKYLIKEIESLKEHKSDRIIKLVEYFPTKSGFHVLMLEYMSGGELEKLLKARKLTESESQFIF